ncbi:hypothetical protein WJX73_004952 [Symbiochloris irregularis]|uniref:Succinate dehydrogenase [ubiquinone] cytochrome b small subunit n=1 Tax=Symbiochloris irregularis TaxID=706552 RepID=A0AAW1Q3D2_9CHLO
MSVLTKLLKPDIAGGPETFKLYEYSHVALAGLVPIAAFAPEGGALSKVTDLTLGVAIPVHSHVAMNAVVTDYVPKAFRGASRAGLLAAASLAAIGFLRLNVFGPGITQSVKDLWRH